MHFCMLSYCFVMFDNFGRFLRLDTQRKAKKASKRNQKHNKIYLTFHVCRFMNTNRNVEKICSDQYPSIIWEWSQIVYPFLVLLRNTAH